VNELERELKEKEEVIMTLRFQLDGKKSETDFERVDTPV
jgi:hypothetical protein